MGPQPAVEKMPMDRKRSVLQFKVTLADVTPSVWRRIQIPAGYTFWDFHVAVQDAMGWLDYHLHTFRVQNPASGDTDEIKTSIIREFFSSITPLIIA